MNETLPRSNRTWPTLIPALQYPPAMLLLLAAILKTHQMPTTPFDDNLLFPSRIANGFLVACEIGMAGWLVSAWHTGVGRVAGIVLFVVFSLITFGNVLATESNCGCLGVIQVPPVVMLTLDMAMAGLLFFWKPGNSVRPIWNKVSWSGTSILALTCIVYCFSLTSQSLENVGDILEDGQLVIVDCDKWINKPLPIKTMLDRPISPEFESEASLVLFHDKCSTCQQLIAHVKQQSKRRYVFVEVPPFERALRNDTDAIAWRRLSGNFKWFVEAPELIRLKNGIVTSVDHDPL